MIVPLASADEPRLEPYLSVRERDLAGRDGLFVIEGRVVLEKALRVMPERIVSVLLAEARAPSLAQALGALPAETPVFIASQAVMDQVVGFPIHRGILALGRRDAPSCEAVLGGAGPGGVVIGLVGIANHDNMGGIFRNAAAFAVAGVLIDETCCDPLYRKAIRVSVGGVLTAPFARVGGAVEMVSSLAQAGFDVVALSPQGAEALTDYRPRGRTAVLFGAEGPGLPVDVLARVRGLRIPMADGFDSLNVATTSGIVLHHLAHHRWG